ncbi:MAG: MATE family efflux transporter [Salinivirgaceae bacterium]
MIKKYISKTKNLQSGNFFQILKKIWQAFSEAIRGSDRDFTQISINKAVVLLAIPMVLEMVMESVFAIVDIFFVSKLGADAIATVGITESVLTLIYAVAFGLAMGTNALVSRRIGEKNSKEAANEGVQSIITGLIVAIVIAIPGAIYAKDLLRIMGASPLIINEYSSFTAIMLGGNVVIMLLFVNNAIFRGAGDAAVAMRVLWIANGINLILDPLLIFGLGPFPELGVAGAAVATTTGRGIAVLYQFYILFSGKSRIKLGWHHIQFNFIKIRHLLSISAGGIFQSIIATTSWIFMVRIISHFGSTAVAAYTIAIRIIIFLLLPSWGLSNAAATLVGQNLGAKHPERAEKSVWKVARINMVFLGVLSLAFIAMPGFFIKLFTHETEIIRLGSQCLRIISYGFIFYGLGMVLVQSFNGAGDTKTPTLFNLVAFWMIEIPLAYFLAIIADFKENGVFYAIVIAESSLALMAWYFFKKGKWKTQKV